MPPQLSRRCVYYSRTLAYIALLGPEGRKKEDWKGRELFCFVLLIFTKRLGFFLISAKYANTSTEYTNLNTRKKI